MPACINVRAYWLSASREGLGNRQAPACVYAGTMDVRSVEHPEPTHIHVPRPSRVIVAPPELPLADYEELCMKCDNVEAAESSPLLPPRFFD